MTTNARRFVDVYDKLNDPGNGDENRPRMNIGFNGANSRQSSLASLPTDRNNDAAMMNDNDSSTIGARSFRGGSFYSAPAMAARNRNASIVSGSSMGDGARSMDGRRRLFRERSRIGNRVVKDGVVYYKKVSTDELKRSIQFGIFHFLKEQNRSNMSAVDPQQNLGMHDFHVADTIPFPKTGSSKTPPHEFTDFQLKVYAPNSFRYLRRTFNIDEDDFIHAIGEADLKEVANPGASGAVFYKTSNDRYILKTIRHQETEVLKSFLRYYTLHLLQNKINQRFSFLPTLYGLFNYQKVERTSILGNRLNIRLMVMNNILPSDIQLHEKYDLKGSSVNRKAGPEELAKTHPTYKDTDFIERHPNGIELDEAQYDNVVNSIKRDCMFLESFGIMDYSLLLGIHNLDKSRYNKTMEDYYNSKLDELSVEIERRNSVLIHDNNEENDGDQSPTNLSTFYTNIPQQRRSFLHQKSSVYSQSFFNINAFPARSGRGERLLLYIGIIDILQSYQINKKIEHTLKSLVADSKKISVSHPKFYVKRFLDFVSISVFKRSNLRQSILAKPVTPFALDKRTSVSQESIASRRPSINRPIGFDNMEISRPTALPLPEPINSQETNKRPRINSIYSNKIDTIEEETPSLKLPEEKRPESDEIDSKKPKPIGFEGLLTDKPVEKKQNKSTSTTEDSILGKTITTSNDESYISDESKSRNTSVSIKSSETDDLNSTRITVKPKEEKPPKVAPVHYKEKKIPPPFSLPSASTTNESDTATSVDFKTPKIFKRSKVEDDSMKSSKAEFWPYRDEPVISKPKSSITSLNQVPLNQKVLNKTSSKNQLKNIENLPDKPKMRSEFLANNGPYQFTPTLKSPVQYQAVKMNNNSNRKDDKPKPTEFTVVKNSNNVLVDENDSDNYSDLYEIKSLDGRKMYDKYRTKYDNHLREIESETPKSKPKLSQAEFQAAIVNQNRHVSSFTSSSSLDQVTSFTVDKSQMRRNFMRGAANRIN